MVLRDAEKGRGHVGTFGISKTNRFSALINRKACRRAIQYPCLLYKSQILQIQSRKAESEIDLLNHQFLQFT